MSNYIPNLANIFDDQDLAWMNTEIQNLVTAKNEVFKTFKN